MENIFMAIAKKFNQKELLKQMMQFLNDECVKDKRSCEEWLIELKYCTNAHNLRGITYEDLKKYTERMMKREASDYRRMESAKIVRKFFRYGIAHRWVSAIPSETLKPTTKDDKMMFMNKILKGWRRGPMPNPQMVKRVRYLRNTCGKSFRDIVAILEKETNKKQYLSSIYKWYSTKSA